MGNTWRPDMGSEFVSGGSPVSGDPIPPVGPDGANIPLDTAPYVIGGLLGRGGMGEVRVAWDSKLGRDVAMKTARPDDADASQRLSREAALTARLEHPNIVPVYSSGRDKDGQPFYTMRVLPGRSLANAIVEAGSGEPGLAARLRLVRHVLDTAEALAFAHGRGVIHRDLKPANIMVGAFGETLVADWGLACTLDEVATVRGGGTPGYMSPEQGRGDLLDVRTDVYGLGAVLYELLVGSPPPPAARGQVPTVRAIAPGVPPELAAIADRALQADREARYPSARAFGDDLLAWFEGRRVAAHDYSLRDVLIRVWTAWRVPLTVGATGLVALALAVGIGWYRTAQESERARAAGAAEARAREAEESALAEALLTQALTVADADRAMEAEILAVNALVRRETPEARGVLARFAGRPRMALIARSSKLPPCKPRLLSPDGERLICGGDGVLTVRDPIRPERVLFSLKGDYPVVAFAGGSNHILLDDGKHDSRGWAWQPPASPWQIPFDLRLKSETGYSATPGQIPIVTGSATELVDVGTRTAIKLHPCEGMSDKTAALATDGVLFTACSDRSILRGPVGGPYEVFARLSDRDDIQSLALPDGAGSRQGLIVGTVRGVLIVLHPDGSEQRRLQVGSEAIGELDVFRTRIAALAGSDALRVWATDSGLQLGRLFAPRTTLAWRNNGEVLRIVGTHTEDRRVPALSRPHLIPTTAGVSALSLSPDGARVAVALGDGTVSEIRLEDGRVLGSWKWQSAVAKDVSYRWDGTQLATATAGHADQRVLSVPGGTTAAVFSDRGLRRITYLRSGWLIAAPYANHLLAWREGEAEPRKILEAAIGELEADATGHTASAIGDDDVLWRLEDGDPPTLRRIGVVTEPTSAAPLGADTMLTSVHDVLRIDAHGREVGRWAMGEIATELAVSADGRYFAVGLVNGNVLLWRVGGDAPLARMIGHMGRVGALAFSADGRWLVSGGWDDAVRVWSLQSIEEPAERERARIEAEWGRGLADVLTKP